MRRTTRSIMEGAFGIAIIGIAIGGGTALATVDGGGDREVPITGEALARATAAALAHTGGGMVTEAEAEAGGTYEVEITRTDGRRVEVHLGRDFRVLRSEPEDDRANGGNGGGNRGRGGNGGNGGNGGGNGGNGGTGGSNGGNGGDGG